jgi:hypothetical protein
MTIDECLTKPKKPHPKNPSVKSMVPPAPRECNQPARSALHRKQFAAHRNQFAAHRPAHPVHHSAPRECNQPARSASHRKQSAHRAARRPLR